MSETIMNDNEETSSGRSDSSSSAEEMAHSQHCAISESPTQKPPESAMNDQSWERPLPCSMTAMSKSWKSRDHLTVNPFRFLLILLLLAATPGSLAFSVTQRNWAFPRSLDNQHPHHHCSSRASSACVLLQASKKDASESGKSEKETNNDEESEDDKDQDEFFSSFTDPDEDTQFEKRISKFTATAIAAERAAEREEMRKLRQELGAELDDEDDEEDDDDDDDLFFLEESEESNAYEYTNTQSVNPEYFAQPNMDQAPPNPQTSPPLRIDSFDGAAQVSYFSTPSPDSFHFSPFAAPIPSANNLNTIPIEGQYTPEAAEALLSLALFESRCGRMARSQQAWEQLIYLLQLGGESTGRELVTNLLRFAKWAELEAANVPLARKLYNDLLQLAPHAASQVKQPWVFRQWAAFEERQGEYERSAIIISFIEELMPSPFTSGTVEPARHFGKQTLLDGTPLKDNAVGNNDYSGNNNGVNGQSSSNTKNNNDYSGNNNGVNGQSSSNTKTTYVTTVSPVTSSDGSAPSTLPQTTATNLPTSSSSTSSWPKGSETDASPSVKARPQKAMAKKKTVASWTTAAAKPKSNAGPKPWMSPQKKANPWQPKKKSTSLKQSSAKPAEKTSSPFVPSGDGGWKPSPPKKVTVSKKFNPGSQTAGWKSIAAGAGGAASAAAKRFAKTLNSQQLSNSKHAIDEAIHRLDEAIASIKNGDEKDSSTSVIDNAFEDTAVNSASDRNTNNKAKPFASPGAAGGTEAYEPSVFGTKLLPNSGKQVIQPRTSANDVSKPTKAIVSEETEVDDETDEQDESEGTSSFPLRRAIDLGADKARSRLQSRLDRLHREASTDARSRLLTRLSQLNAEARLVSRSRGIDHDQVFLEQEEAFEEESKSWPLEQGEYVMSEGEEEWIQSEARIAEKSQQHKAVKNDFGGQSLPRHSLFEDEESPHVDSTSLGQRLGNHIII